MSKDQSSYLSPPLSRSQINTPSESSAVYVCQSGHAHRNMWNQLPWYTVLRLRVRALRAEFYHIVHISAVETRNLPRRIRIQLREIRSLPLGRIGGTPVIPTHPCLSTWKPSRSECTRQVKALTPWVSLYDLSLCLQGWEAAIESLRRHIQDSGMKHSCTQTSNSRNP